MLSTKNITSAQVSSHYYTAKDNYYTQAEGIENSAWYGKGAERLGLIGKIDPEKFTLLLDGYVENERLGILREGKWCHREGFDLTFSSPKSVSLMRLIAGDDRITELEDKAADYVLDRIQKDCAQARKTVAGNTVYEDTGNLIIAKFHHDVSRALDPASHIHATVINATQRADGKWRSLASQPGKYDKTVTREINGFMERVRHRKKFYGALYAEKLAEGLEGIGYTLSKTEDNFFKITQVSQDVIDFFSKRRKEILDYMEDKGFSGAKAAAAATQITRKQKETVDRVELYASWQAQAEAIGFNHQEIYKGTLNQSQNINTQGKNKSSASDVAKDDPFKNINPTALVKTRLAVQHLMERNYTLLFSEIIRMAETLTLGEEKIGIGELVKAANALKRAGEIVSLADHIDERRLTTRENIENEISVLALAQQGQQAVKPLISSIKMEKQLASHKDISHGDKQALATLLGSDDRVICISSSVHSNKIPILRAVSTCFQEKAGQVIGLTHKSVERADMDEQLQRTKRQGGLFAFIKNSLGAQSIANLNKYVDDQEWKINNMRASTGNTLLIVDEAQRCHPTALKRLLNIANRLNYRVILAGDNHAVANHKVNLFAKLIEEGITTITLADEHNSNRTSRTRATINETLSGNITGALEKIADGIVPIEDEKIRYFAMAVQYSELTKAEQDKAVILMQTSAQCEKVNHLVHGLLQGKGHLGQQSISMEVLLPKRLSQPQRCSAGQYTQGQWVRFNVACKELGIGKREYLQVQAKDITNNTIVLKSQKGKSINWDPYQTLRHHQNGVEVFNVARRDFRVGDKIIYLRGNQEKRIDNGDLMTITDISNRKLSLSKMSGEKISITVNDKEVSHFDYGYARTVYQTTGHDYKHVIASQHSCSRQTDQKQFYSVLRHAAGQVTLYTDNRAGYLRNVMNHAGDRVSLIALLVHLENYIDLNRTAQDISTVSRAKSILQSALAMDGHGDFGRHIRQAFKYNISHMSYRESGFSIEELKQNITKQMRDSGKFGNEYAVEDIGNCVEVAINILNNNKSLLTSTDNLAFGIAVTAEECKIEKSIVAITKGSENSVSSLFTEKNELDKLNQIKLNAEQRQVGLEMLTTRHGIHLIQGAPGVGKTYVLQQVKNILEADTSKNYQILGLAPTNKAVKELSDNGITAMTVDSFISDLTKNKLVLSSENTILYLDESSMLSNDKMQRLLSLVDSLKIRLFEVGDKQQLPSPASGKPFTIQQAVVEHVTTLSKVIRQEDAHLLAAVEAQIKQQTKDAFSILEPDIISINCDTVSTLVQQGVLHESDLGYVENKDGKKELDAYTTQLNKVVSLYLSQSLTEQNNTLLITPAHADRNKVNELIHNGLIEQGVLIQPDNRKSMYNILERKDNTDADLACAITYKPGQVVRFCHDNKELQIKSGDYWSVTETYVENNLVVLSNSDNRTIVWEPIRYEHTGKVPVERYNVSERQPLVNEKIVWTRTDKKLNLLGSEIFHVKALTDNRIILIDKSNKEVVMDPSLFQFMHWDYAYALTTHRVQGHTSKNAILLMRSTQKYLANAKNWLVAISRSKQALKVITDDQTALCEQIKNNSGEKYSALEILNFLPQNKEPLRNEGTQKGNSRPERANAYPNVDSQQQREKTANSKSLFSARVGEVCARLSENAGLVAEQILGVPKSKNANHYIYSYGEHFGGGSSKDTGGSLAVCVSGDKRGLWYCFKNGTGGNLLQLIQMKGNLSFQEAIDESCKLLGIGGAEFNGDKFLHHQKSIADVGSETIAKKAVLSQGTMRFLQDTLKTSVPVTKDTLAHKYLTEIRGLALKNLPASVKYNSGVYSSELGQNLPALVAFVKDSHGRLCGLQSTYLDSTGNKMALEVDKRTRGSLKNAFVDVTSGRRLSGLAVYTEGLEDGLSLAQSLPGVQIKVSLGKGNLSNIKADEQTTKIVICVDNDYLKARGKLEEDQAALKATCKVLKNNPHVPVFIGMPREVKDVNDLLKTQGEAAVRDLVEQARDVRKIFTAEQLATGMAVGGKSSSYTKESGAVKMNDESLVKSVVRQEHKQVTYESERAISDREIG